MANFDSFISSIQQAEGGFQKFKADKGNYNSLGQLVGTNHGISAKLYESIIGRPPSESDMRRITKSEALAIFKTRYWDKLKADYINSQAIAETLVDHGINAGVRSAGKLMQRTLNEIGYPVKVDGVIGLGETIPAINRADEKELFSKFNKNRINFYQNLSNYSAFGHSWTSRVYALIKKFPMEAAGGGLAAFLGLILIGFIIKKYN